MTNALIMHGTGGSSQENWFPWLHRKLENLAYKVWTPDLPDAHRPNPKKYKQHILTWKNFSFTKETIIIGHSSGAVATLSLLQALPEKTKIKACYLVGAFKDNLGLDIASELFSEPFDFEKIKIKSRLWYVIHSDDDPYVPLEHAQYLHQHIGGDLIVLAGQKHFSVSTFGEDYCQFPFLYHLIASDAMTSDAVVDLYQAMQKQGVTLWIDGGWGVDALLEKQTRPHGDVDLVVQKKDLDKLDSYLKKNGYFNITRDDDSPYNYVLGNKQAQFVDIHVIELDENGNGIYGLTENANMYKVDALSGIGRINGVAVKCISPEWVVRFHTGYQLRDSDYHDVLAICEKFKINLPNEYRKQIFSTRKKRFEKKKS